MTWQDSAACRGKPTDWWYPTRGEEPHPEALALCAGCPVAAACFDHALRFPERVGFWAGTSAEQRRKMREADARQRGALTCTGCGAEIPRARQGRRQPWCDDESCQREANRRRNVAWRARGVAS